VIGDLSKPLFGLTKKEFKDLSSSITTIYHCGAWVNGLFSYNDLKDTNVNGTKTAIHLATKGKLKPLHFISTISIIPDRSKSESFEIETNDGDLIFHIGGYSQSKWVAEKIIIRAFDKGLPGTIFRPSTIGGDVSSGVSNPIDLVNRIICSIILLNSYPENIAGYINWAPVNFCSSTIVEIGQNWNKANHLIFHLVNEKCNTSWKKIISSIKSYGYNIKPVKDEEWIEMLKNKSLESEILKSMVGVLTPERFKNKFKPIYNSGNVKEYLQGNKEIYDSSEKITETIIHKYITHFIEKDMIPVVKE